MENTRVAILGIIISDMDSVEPVNALLHENSPYIIGRMGLPYRKKGINIISIVMDAPQQIISTLSGRIGRLNGISCKKRDNTSPCRPSSVVRGRFIPILLIPN